MKFAIRIAAIAVMAGLGGLACDQATDVTDDVPDGENTAPTAVVGSDRQVDVGSTVTLDGSESSDPDGDPLTYSWQLASVPAGSNASVNDPSSASTTFVPDSTGDYTAVLEVSDGTETDADTVVITAQLNTDLSGTISQDTTLEDVGQDYHVAGELSVDAALVVEPGVTIRFASDASLVTSTSGSINAVGTASDTIVFTGTTEEAGHWRGLGFRSNDGANELTHVEIAYGGGASLYSIDGDGNVGVENGAQVKISNAYIHHSGAAGVYAESDASLPEFASNTISENTAAPVVLPFRLMGAVDTTSTYANNTEAYIDVYSASVDSDMSVDALDVPYRVDGNSDVNAAMSVAPGAAFEFRSDAGFYVDTDGSLAAVGEAESPITFVGTQDQPGYWKGIGFRSNDGLNELTYVEVAHGGTSSQFSIDVTGNVAVENGARVKVTNSTFRDGSHYGLATESDADLPDFSTNSFADNAEGQVLIPLRLAGQMDGASSYSTGSSAFVDVYSSSVGSDVSIAALDVRYRIAGNSDVSGAMTIEPGAVLEFESDAGMYADTEGSISAVGTETDTIVITSVQETAGYWRGIGFRSNDGANELKYVSIGYGGSNSQWSIEHTGNVGIENDARVSITNSLIHNSGEYGVASEGSGILTGFASNRFEGNSTASVYLPMAMAGMLDSGSEFAPDQSGYVAIYATSVDSDMTFAKLDVPYRVSGNSAFNAAVSAEPGAVFEFTSDAGFYANTDGSFNAVGTATDTIRFTGVQGVQGAWKGLGFRSNNPANVLTYVEVAHGGSSSQWSIGDAANVGIEANARLTVSDAFIHESAGWGIWAGTDATVSVTGVDYANNASGDQNF
ncbi:MAG: PKD domain-containing protein [Longimicrobiales bacterium]